MTKKFIFIPVVNHFDLLQKAINSVPDFIFDKYYIINNSNNKKLSEIIDLKQFTIFDTSRALTFIETQNIMREYAIKNNYDYYSFMHNDGEILDDCPRRLIQYADEKISKNEKFGAIFTNYDVFCIYSTYCVKNIGMWGDSLWPEQKSGYLVDIDYYKRMNFSGYPTEYLPNVNVSHYLANTIKDEKEKTILDIQMPLVKIHYREKWGGDFGHETKNALNDSKYNHHYAIL